MKKTMKRLTALGLSAVMACSVTACGGDSKETTAAATTAAKAETTAAAAKVEETTAAPVDDGCATITQPLTIQIWHASSAGVNETYMNEAIEAFNSTNQYGITVEGTYAGGYGDVLSKTSTAIAAQESPHIVVLGSSGMPILGDEGMLVDMTPYANRDGIDMANFVEGTTKFCYNGDAIVSLPFNRSTAVFAYNKTMWDELGLEPPTSLEDLEVKAAAITAAKPDVYGTALVSDVWYYQEAMIRSLGSDGWITKDGKNATGLDDGNVEKLFTDWRRWIDEGWCAEIPVEKADANMKEKFSQQKLASYFVSCGSVKNMAKTAAESGFEMGVSFMPVYGGYGSNGGGGNLCIVGAEHSDEEIAAAWEFVKFLESDEWVIKRSVDTGYLPVTQTAAASDEIKAMWEADPLSKIAFEQLQYTGDANWSVHQSEYGTYIKQAVSYVVQDGSMTPAEAVEYLKQQAKIVFVD